MNDITARADALGNPASTPSAVIAGGTTLDLLNVMSALYASEINCQVGSFWDGGFTVYLGDDTNGLHWVAEVSGPELSAAGIPLAIAALRAYPTSGFAHWLGFDADRVHENIGWLGSGASTIDHFRCEFCGQEHLDCTLIEHTEGCPILACRAAVLEASGITPSSTDGGTT